MMIIIILTLSKGAHPALHWYCRELQHAFWSLCRVVASSRWLDRRRHWSLRRLWIPQQSPAQGRGNGAHARQLAELKRLFSLVVIVELSLFFFFPSLCNFIGE